MMMMVMMAVVMVMNITRKTFYAYHEGKCEKIKLQLFFLGTCMSESFRTVHINTYPFAH
jgi:hypothetical protein